MPTYANRTDINGKSDAVPRAWVPANPGCSDNISKKKIVTSENQPGPSSFKNLPEIEFTSTELHQPEVLIKVDGEDILGHIPKDDSHLRSSVKGYFKKIVNLFNIIQYDVRHIGNTLGIPERVEPAQNVQSVQAIQPIPSVQPIQQIHPIQSMPIIQPMPTMPIMQQQLKDDNYYSLLDHYLPINDVENINHFEMLIATDPDANRQFREMLTRIGGRSVKENIHNALKKLFTNSCAKQCSWMGRKNNFKVSDLSFVKTIKNTFCGSSSGITEAEFENIGSEWFRFAKQRLIREELKLKRNSGFQYEPMY
ncbi:uncharacterized protein LOC117182852 [Belonocnema kinseyi]|uniref:uncharacterized protein LOC117182852 n=1 Tax=Belonocnema kinseyi TaxID=2817044 RepID=UPI00143CF15E|nr:uncharacterized protein LOC117182852 [Belonocnema kinseyi]